MLLYDQRKETRAKNKKAPENKIKKNNYAKGKEYMALACDLTDGVNNNIVPKMGLGGSQIRDIAAFIKDIDIDVKNPSEEETFLCQAEHTKHLPSYMQ